MQVAFQKAWKWRWELREATAFWNTRLMANEQQMNFSGASGMSSGPTCCRELWIRGLQGSRRPVDPRSFFSEPHSEAADSPLDGGRAAAPRSGARTGLIPGSSEALGGSSRGSTWWDTSASVRGLLNSTLASPRTNPSSFCSILWPQSQVWKKWPFHSWGSGRGKKK